MNSLSFKTKFGWITAFGKKNKIVRVKFGKYKNKSISANLKKIKSNINNFLNKKNNSNFDIKASVVQNKIVLAIPCHRVIRSDGSIGGFSSVGGISLKQKLLNFKNSWK